MKLMLAHVTSDPEYRRRVGLRTANWPIRVGLAWMQSRVCGVTLRLGNRLHILMWR